MAITSFTKNFSVPKEKSEKFVDDMTKDAQPISLKNFTSKRGSLSDYQKELKRVFGRWKYRHPPLFVDTKYFCVII